MNKEISNKLTDLYKTLNNKAKKLTIPEQFGQEKQEFCPRFAESQGDAYEWGKHDAEIMTARQIIKQLEED